MFKQAMFIAFTATLVAAGLAVFSLLIDYAPSQQAATKHIGDSRAGIATSKPRSATNKTLVFETVSVPVTDSAKRAVIASRTVKIDGRDRTIGFQLMARSGQKFGKEVFGRLVDEDGRALKKRNGTDRISHNADFTSLLQRGRNFFSITQFESTPGAMYVSQLQKGDGGNFAAISIKSVDFSELGGLWAPCAGVVTPWDTHLGGEEFPPDGRTVNEWKDMIKDVGRFSSGMLRYFGIDRGDPGMSLKRIRAQFNPYRYGFPFEVDIDEQGNSSAKKHYAMGRASLELAYIMPDERTVYMSDDRINGGFYMFVADKKRDLSSGTLFAAKWLQKDAKRGGRADLDWIPLGHATHDDVSNAISKRVRFSDMFDVADQKNGVCPQGLKSIAGGECLRVKPGMAMLASRLETRRYAALMGATTEFSKSEGITFDANSDTLYLAMSNISRSMEDNRREGKPNRKYDMGGPNHIKLSYNGCGAVYGMNLGQDRKIGSDYVAKSMRAVLVGYMKSYPKKSGLSRNTCDVEKIANPDNLTFISGHGVLIISEDSGSGHQNDAVWAFDVKKRSLTRIKTTPYGSEATSPYWYPNLDGYGYLVSVVQHPYGESDGKFRKTAEEAGAYVGYLGPFPKMD